MMGRRAILAFVVVVAAAFWPGPTLADENAADGEQPPSTAEWRAAAYPFNWKDRVEGPGADWLSAQGSDAQFVLFGEQHGVEGVAQIIEGIFARLSQQDELYLALEMGPWVSERIAALGVDAAIEAAPYSIAFDSDGDLDLMRRVAALRGSEAIWGLDQSVTAIHPFARLHALAETAEQRRLAAGAFWKAVIKRGEYLREDHSGDLAVLSAVFDPDPDSEAQRLLRDLATSTKIYQAFRAGRRGEISRQVSPTLRETYMKDRLDAYLDRHSVDGLLPKVVFKMGGAHVTRGVGPNGIKTLGDHAEQRAAAAGGKAFLVAVRAHGDVPFYPPAAVFGEAQAVSIDLRRLAADLGPERLALLPAQLRDDIGWFDALVLVRAPQRASRSEISASQRDFRSDLIVRAGGFFAALAVLLLGAIPAGHLAWQSATGRIGARSKPIWPGILLGAAAIAMIAVLTIQILVIQQSNPAPHAQFGASFLATGWLPLLAVLSLGAILSAGAALLRAWWGPIGRLQFVASAIAAAALAFIMIVNNLGGMLG